MERQANNEQEKLLRGTMGTIVERSKESDLQAHLSQTISDTPSPLTSKMSAPFHVTSTPTSPSSQEWDLQIWVQVMGGRRQLTDIQQNDLDIHHVRLSLPRKTRRSRNSNPRLKVAVNNAM